MARRRRRRGWGRVAAATLVLLGIGLALWLWWPRASTGPATARRASDAAPPEPRETIRESDREALRDLIERKRSD